MRRLFVTRLFQINFCIRLLGMEANIQRTMPYHNHAHVLLWYISPGQTSDIRTIISSQNEQYLYHRATSFFSQTGSWYLFPWHGFIPVDSRKNSSSSSMLFSTGWHWHANYDKHYPMSTQHGAMQERADRGSVHFTYATGDVTNSAVTSYGSLRGRTSLRSRKFVCRWFDTSARSIPCASGTYRRRRLVGGRWVVHALAVLITWWIFVVRLLLLAGVVPISEHVTHGSTLVFFELVPPRAGYGEVSLISSASFERRSLYIRILVFSWYIHVPLGVFLLPIFSLRSLFVPFFDERHSFWQG